MGVVIRVVSTGEVLDIPKVFALENTIASAFFSTEGSQAVPVSLPMTAKNTAVFGYANRSDRRNKANKEIEVIVSKGSYSRKGTLHLESVSESESTYSARIVYDESNLYQLQSQLKVNELPNLPVIYKPTDELIREMQTLLTVDDPDNPLTVFKIFLKNEGTYKKEIENGEVTEIVHFPLNDFNYGVVDVSLIVKDTIDIVKDDRPLTITSLKGVGISPFVRVWYIIDLIAEHYGYTVGENPFKTHFQLRRLTALNNSADTIVADRFFYSDIMPQVTITEFFQFLWARFGAKVFIDGNTNTLNIKLIKNSINYTESTLLPTSGKIDTEQSAPKQLKLSAAKNLEKSDTDTDSYEEFLKKYNNTIGDMRTDFYEDGVAGVLLNNMLGLYYRTSMSRFDEEGNLYGFPESISSIHFDWDKKEEGMEYEEITSPDECLTMYQSLGVGEPYYALEFAIYNSIFEVDREIQDRNEPNRLAVCWDMGQFYRGDGIKERDEQGYKFGSIFPYMWVDETKHQLYIDREGNTYNYALMWIGKHGCFENFWKEYDAVLRHSNDQVTGKLNLQTFDFSTLDPSVPYIIGNQKMLLKDFKYVVGTIDVDNQEFNAMTLGLYEPYDLEKEQAHPVPDPILYKWELRNNREQKLQERADKYETDFVETPVVKFVSCSWVINKDDNPPTMDGSAYYPPTKEEAETEAQRGTSEHRLEATYTIRTYQFISIPNGQSEWRYIDIPQGRETILYEGFFIAVDRNS